MDTRDTLLASIDSVVSKAVSRAMMDSREKLLAGIEEATARLNTMKFKVGNNESHNYATGLRDIADVLLRTARDIEN